MHSHHVTYQYNTFIGHVYTVTNNNHEMGHLHVNACDHRMIEILSSMMYIHLLWNCSAYSSCVLPDIPIDSDNNTFIGMITNSNHEMGHLHAHNRNYHHAMI